jgi:hypothetical protein
MIGIFFLLAFLLALLPGKQFGCTAGHCIMGMSQFSFASFVFTNRFFIGRIFSSFCF